MRQYVEHIAHFINHLKLLDETWKNKQIFLNKVIYMFFQFVNMVWNWIQMFISSNTMHYLIFFWVCTAWDETHWFKEKKNRGSHFKIYYTCYITGINFFSLFIFSFSMLRKLFEEHLHIKKKKKHFFFLFWLQVFRHNLSVIIDISMLPPFQCNGRFPWIIYLWSKVF